jgi:hypothetical protein
VNEFLSALAQRAPQIALAFLAANRGGPQAAAAFQGGLLESQQRQQALARQAQLDEEHRQAQAAQLKHLESSDELARRHADLQSQQADFQRRQAAVQTLWHAIQQQGDTATEPAAAENTLLGQATGLEGFYGVPSGSLSPMVPNMSGPVGRGVRKDAADILAGAEQRLMKQNPRAEISDDTVSFQWGNASPRLQKWLVSQGHPEGQPFKPSQLSTVVALPKITAPPIPQADKRGFATKDITLNGKRLLAGYDPDTNQYFAPGDTKTPLAGDIQEYNKPDKPGAAAGLSPGMEANVLNRLTTQWTAAVKPVAELSRQVKMMDAGLAAAERGDLAQGAQAVLVTFQKILDPNSVVRESEYMRSAAGLSLLNRVQGAYERLTRGGAGVPLPELKKFAQVAREAAQAQAGGYVDAVKGRLGRTADRYKIPRELVFEDYDFGAALGGNVATGEATMRAPTRPQRGERRMINGQLGEWDGKGWAPVGTK